MSRRPSIIIVGGGLRRTPDGGLNASRALSWPEQRAAGVEPIVLDAHPHPRGTTVHDWPLNVPNEQKAHLTVTTCGFDS